MIIFGIVYKIWQHSVLQVLLTKVVNHDMRLLILISIIYQASVQVLMGNAAHNKRKGTLNNIWQVIMIVFMMINMIKITLTRSIVQGKTRNDRNNKQCQLAHCAARRLSYLRKKRLQYDNDVHCSCRWCDNNNNYCKRK